MCEIQLNGIPFQADSGDTILKAARKNGIELPSLCQHEDLTPSGRCGLCMVRIEGVRDLQRACMTQVQEGMRITTRSPELRKLRRELLDLILASHPADCLSCIKHGQCELQKLADQFELREAYFDSVTEERTIDRSSESIVRDMNKCIGCGRCIEVCHQVQSVRAIDFQGRGAETIVSPGFGETLATSLCVNCGQCTVYCPVGALYEKEDTERVWEALEDSACTVAVQMAPSVRVALGEEFGMAPGELVIGKIYAALRRLGADFIFDTNFSADLTIVEEGTELLRRLEAGGPLPLITSCSPGWIRFGETFYSDLLENLSSCKSPQQMLGALIKTQFALQRGLDPGKVFSLSIMPCTAKKYEAARPEMNASGVRDVDAVLTTRELARMIRQEGIQFSTLEEESPDPFLSQYSGAATLFGASGGVMEAALRSACEMVTGESFDIMEFSPVRGMEGIKEATLTLGETELRVAAVSGLGNARTLLDRIRQKRADGQPLYHFIEIMACRGGCIGGGGQPLPNTLSQRLQRQQGLYKEDAGRPVRQSHRNSEVQALYRDFLGKPGGETAHRLLHTHYHESGPQA